MADSDEAVAQGDNSALLNHLTDITKEIHELKEELKREITSLESSFKQEFVSFKEDVSNKLKDNIDKLYDQRQSLTEAQTRIEALKTFNMGPKKLY